MMFSMSKTFRACMLFSLLVAASAETRTAFPWRKAFFTTFMVTTYLDAVGLNRLYREHACCESVQNEVESNWSDTVKMYRNLLSQYDAAATERINSIALDAYGFEFAELNDARQDDCIQYLCDNPTVELQMLHERILAIEQSVKNVDNRRDAYEENKAALESKITYAKCAVMFDVLVSTYLGYTLYRKHIAA